MQSFSKADLVGFLELQVGSMAVQVPIRHAEPALGSDGPIPLATFEADGSNGTIVIRGDSTSRAVEKAVGEVAKEALAHLSRKLLSGIECLMKAG